MGEQILAMKKPVFDIFKSTSLAYKHELLEDLLYDSYKDADFNQLLVSVDRAAVETDPTVKQIIPYVVIIDRSNNILTYTRKGSESRLVGKVSIGFGGHWKTEESFFQCIRRELSEELGITNFYEIAIEIEDTIYSEETEVDSVHYGILVSAIVDALEKVVSRNENNEVKDIKTMTLDEIDPDKLETWSKIAFSKLISTIALEEMISTLEEGDTSYV